MTFIYNSNRSLETTTRTGTVFSSNNHAKLLLNSIGLVGLAENILVIVAIITDTILLDVPSNWFVLSLAVSDALVCIVIFPPLIDSSISEMDVYGAFVALAFLSSSTNLSLLTFNRFLSIYNSLKYPRRMTLRRSKCLVACMWIITVFLSTGVTLSNEENLSKLRYIGISFYTAISALIIMQQIYMFRTTKVHLRAIQRQRMYVSTGQQKSWIREHRSLFRLTLVTLIYFGTCAPNIIIALSNPTKSAIKSRTHYTSFQNSDTWLYFMMLINSAADPLVYFIGCREFKRFLTKVKRTFFKRDVGNNSYPTTSTRSLIRRQFLIHANQVAPAEI